MARTSGATESFGAGLDTAAGDTWGALGDLIDNKDQTKTAGLSLKVSLLTSNLESKKKAHEDTAKALAGRA